LFVTSLIVGATLFSFFYAQNDDDGGGDSDDYVDSMLGSVRDSMSTCFIWSAQQIYIVSDWYLSLITL